MATSRRKNKLIDGFLYLKLKNADCGILESLKLPSTDLLQEETEEGFSAEGIKIECAQPMSKWKINFDGKLKDNKKSYEVKLNLVFVSDLPYFNFDTDPHPFAMASAMAREKWSKTYFEILKALVRLTGRNSKFNQLFQGASDSLRAIRENQGRSQNRRTDLRAGL